MGTKEDIPMPPAIVKLHQQNVGIKKYPLPNVPSILKSCLTPRGLELKDRLFFFTLPKRGWSNRIFSNNIRSIGDREMAQINMTKLCLSFCLSATLFAEVTWAQMVSTEMLFERPVTPSSKEKVAAFVAREEVARTYEQMGVDPELVGQRVALMTDEEASRIALEIDTLPAGGDAPGAVIGAGVFIFVLLLITDIIGWTKVFSFTRPATSK